MKNISRIFVVAALVAMILGFGFSVAPVTAAESTFDLYVRHNINGRSLGLEKELPVDVYVNGGYAFTFEFGESFSASLPAGNYFIEVKLAGTNVTVMSLGPTDIPAGVNVSILASLGAQKTPTLKVNVN
ncbi:MAG: DUF4397 domain-containing protein [Anaerolineales bacterium]|nr:DUF4397 domain-containing protein [Anaerolineales bacterium]